MVSKDLFSRKKSRINIKKVIELLTIRVKEPNIDDYKKLDHWMRYLRIRKYLCLIFNKDKYNVIKLYVHTLFAVYPNVKSYDNRKITIGKERIYSMLIK